MARKRKGRSKSTKAAKQFPADLYITHAGDGDGEYFDVSTTAEAAEDGESVAIYELKEVRRKKITHELE
jgi:hypothetical protein